MGARSILLMTSRSERVIPGSALARNLVARGDVDHIEADVRQLGAEGRGKVIAAGFDDDQIEIGKFPSHLRDGRQIDGGVLANRGMGAAARLHAGAVRGQRAGAGEELGVLAGIDVVGDHRDLVIAAHPLAQCVSERGLAGADRPTDADAQRPVGRFHHDRNNLDIGFRDA